MRRQFFLDESTNYPKWEMKQLGELAHIKKGFTPSTEKASYWNGDIPWLSITGFTEKYIKNGNKFISKEALGNKKLFSKGSLVMSFKLTLGKLGILDRPMMTNEAICSFDWRDSSVNNEFAFYALSSIDLVPYANQAAAGLTLNDAALKSIQIPLPSLVEQQKIAAFFGALDERIALTDDKVKLLKEQKTGYLQKVLSQEMVFTDDNGDRYPEWEQKKLRDVLNLHSGKDQKGFEDPDGQYPILATGGEIGRTNTPLCSEESVLIGRKGTIDKPRYINTPFRTVDTLFYTTMKNGISAKFIYVVVQSIQWKKLSEASGVPSLNSSIILNVDCPIPSLPEQERIAEFFSALDEQIELTENKLTLLKDQKKGYLQGIFG